MNIITKHLKTKKKIFTVIFLISTLVYFSLLLILNLFFKNNTNFRYEEFLQKSIDFYTFGLIFTIYLILIVINSNYRFFRLHKKLIQIFTPLLIYHLILHSSTYKSVYLIIIPFWLYSSVIYNNTKKKVLIGLFYIIICLIVQPLSKYLNILQSPISNIELGNIYILNNTILIILYTIFTVMLLYFKYNINKNKKIIDTKNNYQNFNSLDKNIMYEEIYNKIQHVLIQDKAFQDPQLSKAKLAKIINTNETYISKALKLKKEKKIKMYIHKLRIEQVKDDFDSYKFEKFTIEHIYLKAGYVNQSTFNRVFKKITGQTPTDYIENVKKQKKD